MTDAPFPTEDRKNLPPRRAALAAVTAVFTKAAALDGALSNDPTWRALEPRDRAFARAIASAAVRRVGALNAALDALIDRPLPDKAVRARLALLCGAAERLVLDGAAHAAVDAWVSIMDGSRDTQRYKNLANAVLRRIASGKARAAFDNADPRSDLPDWLGARWTKTYGADNAKAMAAARAVPPTLDLSLKPGQDAAAFAKSIDAEVLPTRTVRRREIGAVESLPGFEAGDWWVQDVAAALPVKLLNPQPGEHVADLCAAPGGKTLQLAASGAAVIAVEASAKRMKKVDANLKRTGLSAELVTADVGVWTPDAPLDAVLLDAPCTATGTLRRRPDAAWAKQEGDIASLADIQARLFDAAFAMLKTGGRLVYCTCSLEPEEGEGQLAAFLARTPSARLDPVRPEEAPELTDAITPGGAVRTRPDLWAERGGMDGFFIARLVRA
jgi:16S rRNA (cytosine967-C5)-methyltransferase